MAADKPRKIAILGGGMGGLATAYYLSSAPDWQSRFEITLYQLGHRLGGKCASSRGPFDRIEEHGIHGFLGSYYNALPLTAAVYQELGRKPGQPLATFEEALFGSNFSLLWEVRNGTFQPWPLRAPPNGRSPKDASSYKGLESTIGMIIDAILGLTEAHEATLSPPPAGAKDKLKEGLLDPLKKLLEEARDGLLRIPLSLGPRHPIVGLIDVGRKMIKFLPEVLLDVDELRRGLIVVDYVTTMVLGALTDNVVVNGYDALDDQNWSDWLTRHGIQPATLSSPVARTTVNICYQSGRGDTSVPPVMGAGAYLNWTLKSFDYLGSQIWSFAAGTGETVVAPLYEVLRKRGVRFEFFQKVEALHLDPGKTSVSSVDITVQATLNDPSKPYEPLIDVEGLPSWPQWPRYEQLVEGYILEEARIDLESYWNGWPDEAHKSLRNARVLKAGVDYHTLVLAMYPGANHIADELIEASDRFAHGVQALPAVQTQAMQLWLNRDVVELGYPEQLHPELREFAVSGTYYGPANGHVDFHHLIPRESWPAAAEPKSIWYFCGLMPIDEAQPGFSDTDYPSRQRARVKAQFVQYLQSCTSPLWPRATAASLQTAGDPVSFDFSVLVDFRDALRAPQGDPVGTERFDSQFWRANIDPTELYITSPPGSTSHRMEAWGSGFSNLMLAGDWIYTGINIGSFEGATCSGKLASYAISAYPPLATVIGYPTIPRPPGGLKWDHPPPPHERAAQPQPA